MCVCVCVCFRCCIFLVVVCGCGCCCYCCCCCCCCCCVVVVVVMVGWYTQHLRCVGRKTNLYNTGRPGPRPVSPVRLSPLQNATGTHTHAPVPEKQPRGDGTHDPPLLLSRRPHRRHHIRRTCCVHQAVQYARDYLQPHAATHQAEIQRDMGTLLFPNPQESTVPEWVALFHDDR